MANLTVELPRSPCGRQTPSIRWLGCLAPIIVGLLVGCADHPTAGGSGPAVGSAESAGAATAHSNSKPLTAAELERYARELPALMPERRITTLRGTLTPGAAAVVDVAGFDSVVVARRTASGTTVQACVDDIPGAMDFFGAQRASHAGATE